MAGGRDHDTRPRALSISQAAVISPMWLNACGKLPSSSPRRRVDLLGQQPEVVGVGDELVEQRLGPVDLARLGQRGHEPERADHERSLLAGEAVGVEALVVAVAQHQPVLGQVVGDRVDRRAHPLVGGRQEAEDRHQQLRRVELVRVERLRVGLPRLAPAARQHRVADLRRARPSSARPRRASPSCGASAIARSSATQHSTLRGEVMARLAAHLPHAGVRLAPARARRCSARSATNRWISEVELAELLAVQIQRVEQLAVDVELGLAPGAVADADRGRVAPAAQVGQLALGEVVLAADPVHDLQRALAGASAGRAGHERDEVLGLVRAGADVQRLERQAGVADPGVAVVPVALAADRLGQRGGRGGDDRAGRTVGEALEHARAETHELAVRALVDVVLGLPGAPRLDGVLDPRRDLVRRERLGRRPFRRRPLQREPHPLAGRRRVKRGGHRRVLDRRRARRR